MDPRRHLSYKAPGCNDKRPRNREIGIVSAPQKLGASPPTAIDSRGSKMRCITRTRVSQSAKCADLWGGVFLSSTFQKMDKIDVGKMTERVRVCACASEDSRNACA